METMESLVIGITLHLVSIASVVEGNGYADR